MDSNQYRTAAKVREFEALAAVLFLVVDRSIILTYSINGK